MIFNTVARGGGGDVVSAYALSTAKGLQQNEKVILNYSADMLPYELQLTDETFKDATSNPAYAYNFLYIDKRRLCMGTSITTKYPLPVLLTRQSDGTYAYEKTLDTSSNFLSRQADFIPYGLFVRANTVYKMTAKNTIVSISSSNYIPGTLTYLNDGSLACSGGSSPKLLKNVKGEWEVVASLSGFQTDAYRGYGLIEDKLLVIESSSSPLKTYTYDETGATTLVGSTTIESNVGGTYWRFFDNNTKVIVGTGYNSSDVQRSNLKVFDVTVLESGAYQFTQNSVLTENLASIVQQKVGNLLNVIKMDDNTFFVWGEGGLVYIELLQNMIVEHPTPFKSYTWTKAFFANSIDRVAAMQISPTESIVWFIDAPVTQNWVSDSATDSLFFADKSLTGLVKENNNGILTVSTVLDPNAVVPAYPDTYGLDVTVHPGTANAEQLVPYGTRSNLNNANGLTFFGFMLDEPMTIGGIEMTARTTIGSSSSTNKYLKLFKWNSETNVYDFVACSTNTQQALDGTTARWEFETNQVISGAAYYGFAFSTDNTEAWSGITGSGIQTQSTAVSDDYHLMGSTSTNNPPSSNTFSFIPVFSFIQKGLIEGSVGISYGYFKSGDEYIKAPSNLTATFANIEGEKATTMGLYLLGYKSGYVTPLISTTVPSSTKQEEYYYYSDIMGGGRFSGDEISSFGFNTSSDPGLYMYPVTGFQIRFEDTTPALSAYLKIFVWNDVTNSYDYLNCSRIGEQDEVVMIGVNYNFEHPILLLKDAYYRLVFSSNKESEWADLVSLHVSTCNITTDDYRLMSSTSTNNPPSTNTIACIPSDFAYTICLSRTSYYLQDVYLSDTLDYFVESPGGEVVRNFTVHSDNGTVVIDDEAKTATWVYNDVFASEYIEPNVVISHGTPWEIGVKLELLEAVTTPIVRGIWGNPIYGTIAGFELCVNRATKKIAFSLSSDGSNADIIRWNTISYTNALATISIKLGWNGTQYYWVVTEGDTVLSNETLDNSTPIYTDVQQVIGCSKGLDNGNKTKNLCCAKIYLNDTYIKLNGEIAWRPYSS